MKILYAINGFDPGGAEHGLLTLIESDFFGGHELHVWSIVRGRGDLIGRIRDASADLAITTSSKDERLGLPALLKGVVSLYNVIRREKPDCVVLSLKQTNIIGRAVLTLFPGVKCIAFEHIADYRANKAQAIYPALLKALSFRVDEVWADASETAEQVRRYFFPKASRRFEVVPLFCVRNGLAAKQSYAYAGKLTLSAAGRLVARKNFDLIVRTVADLNAEGFPVCLRIFGDGPEQEKLAMLIDELKATSSVTLEGYRKNWFDDARETDIFVNMSDTEGFCIVVAEAMSVGVPVIATDVGGIRDYGRDGVNMVKVQARGEGLARAIRALAGDEEMRRRIGERGTQDMKVWYGSEQISQIGQIRLCGPDLHPAGAQSAGAVPTEG